MRARWTRCSVVSDRSHHNGQWFLSRRALPGPVALATRTLRAVHLVSLSRGGVMSVASTGTGERTVVPVRSAVSPVERARMSRNAGPGFRDRVCRFCSADDKQVLFDNELACLLALQV